MDHIYLQEIYYGYPECNFIINDNNSIFRIILPWGQMSLWGATV